MCGRKPQLEPIASIIMYSYAINREKCALNHGILGTFIRIFINKNDFLVRPFYRIVLKSFNYTPTIDVCKQV